MFFGSRISICKYVICDENKCSVIDEKQNDIRKEYVGKKKCMYDNTGRIREQERMYTTENMPCEETKCK